MKVDASGCASMEEGRCPPKKYSPIIWGGGRPSPLALPPPRVPGNSAPAYQISQKQKMEQQGSPQLSTMFPHPFLPPSSGWGATPLSPPLSPKPCFFPSSLSSFSLLLPSESFVEVIFFFAGYISISIDHINIYMCIYKDSIQIFLNTHTHRHTKQMWLNCFQRCKALTGEGREGRLWCRKPKSFN